MDHARIVERLRRYEMREALIHRIHPEVNDVIDVDRFLLASVYELGKVMEVDRCDFLIPQLDPLESEDSVGLRVEYEYCRDETLPSAMKAVLPFEGKAEIESLDTLAVNDTSRPLLPPALRALCESIGTVSLLAVPVRFRRELLGVLGLHYCRCPHTWSTDEMELVNSLAQYLAIGLQYTRLYVKMEKEMEATKALLSIANEIHAKHDFAQITSFILARAVDLAKADHGCIWIPGVSDDELRLAALYPEAVAVMEGINAESVTLAASPLLREAMTERHSVRAPDLRQVDPVLAGTLHGRSAVLIPIVIGERAYGVLNLIWTRQRNGLAPHELELVNGITNQIALVIEKNQLSAEVLRLRGELTRNRSVMIVGASEAIEKSIRMALHVAENDTTVLLKGETGTGKELIADLIQKTSLRSDAPYIKLNCGAIPEALIESELFGHEKGAFTDAKARQIGKFEGANGGTVFLDEVGELSPNAQVKLLRVLQQGEVYRIGGVLPVQVDVRVIAATNTDLEAGITEGRFRKDLYYRLNVYPIVLPPLRMRKEDIPLLAHHFLEIYKKKSSKPIIGISEGALRLLQRHDWPGNIRELENAIERAVIECYGIVITEEQLPELLNQLEDESEETAEPNSALEAEAERFTIEVGSSLEQIERCAIESTLKHTGGDKKHAAALLGISRKTLYRKLAKYDSTEGSGE